MIWPTDILGIESWILIFILTLLAKYHLHQRWAVFEKWNIPHDTPTIRNLGHIKNLFIDQPFTFPLKCKAKHGPVYGYYVFFEPRIAIHDAEILRQVCIGEFANFSYRDEEGIPLGCEETNQGLFSVRGEKWKRIRTTLAPAFSSAKLKQMVAIINWSVGNTREMFNRKIKDNGGLFFAKDVFARLSLDVICSAAFSTDVNSQDETKGAPAISKHAKKFFVYGIHGLIRYFSIHFSFFRPLYLYVTGIDHVNYFRGVCEQMAKRRDKDSDRRNRVDLMHLMLDSKISDSELKNGVRKGLTTTEIMGNAITMLIAGYETTGVSMTYLAYNLATHPTVQKKLQEEIDEIYEKGGTLDFAAVNVLKYLNMCVNETLRLYSPVPWTVRIAKNNTTIKGLRIPKGCVVGVPIYALSHDSDFWQDPMEFRPERMENISEIDPLIFQPFGTGPRNCIGSKFAMIEMKLVFSQILRHFSFVPTADTPEPPLEMSFGVTTQPKINFTLRVVPRS